jgi:outer membrane protein assembly factor BamB
VVVTYPRPTYCGVALATIAVWALVVQQPALAAQSRRKHEPPPKAATLLLPAELAWTATLPDSPSAAGVLAGTAIVVPLVSGELHALSRESGETKWVQMLQTHVAPVAAGPHVVVATGTDVEARTIETGDLVWHHALDAPPRALGGLGNRVVVLSERSLTALDTTTGMVLWRQDTGQDAMSLTVGAMGVAVVSTARVAVFSPADGRRLWERELPGPPGPPAWSAKALIVPAGRVLWALNARTGKEDWKWVLGGAPTGIGVGVEDAYVTALDNVLRGLEQGNGHQRWHTSLSTRALHPPVAVDGAVFVSGYSPALSLFDTKTGKSIASYETPARLFGPPLVPLPIRPGSVSTLLLLFDGRLLALRSTGLRFPELPLAPFTALPGRSLGRERLPLAP